MTTLSMQNMSANYFIVNKAHNFRVLFSARGDSSEDVTYDLFGYDYDEDALLKPAEGRRITLV